MKHCAYFVAASALLLSGGAQAHATLQDQTAQAGTTYRAVLRVPHGCGGEATHTVRIQMPEGLYNVKPMPKAGWKLETVRGPYAQPFVSHGKTSTEGVREIIWSEGDLPSDWYDEFVFRGSLGPNLEAGQVLHFPTSQECENGAADWTDTTGAQGVRNPAPKLTIETAPHGEGHHHH